MAELLSSIAALLRTDFAAEADAGFPTVTRIPSTEAVKFLDYFATLEPAGRELLLDGLARLGAVQFFPALVYKETLDLNASNAAIVRYRTTVQSGPFASGLRYVDLRMARMMLSDPQTIARMAQTRSTLNFEPRDDPPKELTPESDIRKIQPAKAPLLRKLLEKAFAQLFSAQKSKLPGGETRYAGSINSTELTVSVHFTSRFSQLYWCVFKMAMANPNLRAFCRISGEAWDGIT
jgi:hypothetical protein